MDRQINRTPLRDALVAAGITEVEGRMLYQDYLNIVAGTEFGRGTQPITEQQWEQMCDMLGGDMPLYPSTVKAILANMKAKAEKAAA